jgi:type IV pilus assembly protein PilC
MPVFSYIVKDEKGKTLSGTVEALNRDEARNILREKKYILISLKEQKESFFRSFIGRFRGVSMDQKALFARQLATMVAAGLPFGTALDVLREQIDNPRMKEVVHNLSGDVQGGKALSEALKRYPDVFSPIFVALTAAGEASGKLEETLLGLADALEKMRNFRAKLIGALIYPALIICVMGAVFIVMVLFVLPRLGVMYENLGAKMPLVAVVMLKFADFLKGFWWLVIVALAAGIYGFYWFLGTSFGRFRWDAFVLKVPVMGSLIRKTQLADFSRTVGLLIGAGVPIIEALKISADAMSNVHYQEAILKAIRHVERGSPLSAPLAANPDFPPILTQMIGVGEETGKMDEALTKMAGYFEGEVDRALHNVTTAIEPFLIIFLGILVGGFVISILVPIYNLIQVI